jgi:hypothetical protein
MHTGDLKEFSPRKQQNDPAEGVTGQAKRLLD